MKNVKFIGYFFFRYYLNGRAKDFPYTRTIGSLTIFTYVQYIIIILAIDRLDWLPLTPNNTLVEKYVTAALSLLPIALFYLIIVKKSELRKMNFPEEKIKKGNRWLLTYLITSTFALLILGFLRMENS